MSDQEVPGGGGYRVDAVERLRRKLEGLKAAENGGAGAADGAPEVTRLPRRPRRMTDDDGERARKTWRSDEPSVYDPAPTRPVQRSELQRETGWWPAEPARAQHPAPEGAPGAGEQDASVVDFGAARRKRAGDNGPAGGIRRVARPRRISAGDDKDRDSAGEGKPDSARPDGPN
ncbi:hypothetical protein [Nocardia sp. IFM 10818]